MVVFSVVKTMMSVYYIIENSTWDIVNSVTLLLNYQLTLKLYQIDYNFLIITHSNDTSLLRPFCSLKALILGLRGHRTRLASSKKQDSLRFPSINILFTSNSA